MDLEKLFIEILEKYLGVRGIAYLGIFWGTGIIFSLNDYGIWSLNSRELLIYESTATIFVLLLIIEIAIQTDALKLD